MMISPTMMVIRSASIATFTGCFMAVFVMSQPEASSVALNLAQYFYPALARRLGSGVCTLLCRSAFDNQRPADSRGLCRPQLTGDIGPQSPKPGSGSRRLRAIPFPA